jgi:hypothetical protein
VDSIELFSGAIILSDCCFEDKIRFLFNFFDFNEEERLGFDVLEFMFISVLNALQKIYSLKCTEG